MKELPEDYVWPHQALMPLNPPLPPRNRAPNGSATSASGFKLVVVAKSNWLLSLCEGNPEDPRWQRSVGTAMRWGNLEHLGQALKAGWEPTLRGVSCCLQNAMKSQWRRYQERLNGSQFIASFALIIEVGSVSWGYEETFRFLTERLEERVGKEAWSAYWDQVFAAAHQWPASGDKGLMFTPCLALALLKTVSQPTERTLRGAVRIRGEDPKVQTELVEWLLERRPQDALGLEAEDWEGAPDPIPAWIARARQEGWDKRWAAAPEVRRERF